MNEAFRFGESLFYGIVFVIRDSKRIRPTKGNIRTLFSAVLPFLILHFAFCILNHSVTPTYFLHTASAAGWETGLPNTQEEGADRSSGLPAKLVETPPASERITDPAA